MREFVWPVRVYWEDTDAGGVVYYANYLRFLERARSEWLRALGIHQAELMQTDKVVFVVRRVEVDYLAPARFDEALQVRCRIALQGRASLVMTQTIERAADAVRLLDATVRLACVSADALRPVKIPSGVLERLQTR